MERANKTVGLFSNHTTKKLITNKITSNPNKEVLKILQGTSRGVFKTEGNEKV